MSEERPDHIETNKHPHLLDLISNDGVSRRQFVHWLGTSASTAVFLGRTHHGLAAAEQSRSTQSKLFQFQGVPVSKDDKVVVPEGYVAEVLYRWGDPTNGEGPQFKPDATNTADEQLLQAGMGHDP